jgi:bile acid-coenzyme A ligase
MSRETPLGVLAGRLAKADPDRAGRTTIPVGFEPDPSLSSDPLPPEIAASFKAPTSGGSTGRPKLIVATQAAVWEALEGFATLTATSTSTSATATPT